MLSHSHDNERDIGQATMLVPKLPDELWLEIIRYSEREDLRSIRLLSKSHASLPVSRLFHTLVMRPNIDSLKRAVKVADTPALAAVVQELHLRSETLPKDVGRLGEFMFANQFRFVDEPQLGLVEYDKFFGKIEHLKNAERMYNSRTDEGKELTKLLTRLPALRHVQRYYDWNGKWWDASSSFATSHGLRTLEGRSTFLPHNILRACAQSSAPQIKSLCWNNIEWSELELAMAVWRPNNVKGLLNHILKLDVSLALFGSQWSLSEEKLRLFHVFLSQFGKAEDVTLNLNSDGGPHHPDALFLWRGFCDSVWLHLRSIHLKNFSGSERELLNFLEWHAKTLKNLTISDITMHNEPVGEWEVLNSVMRLIWTIPHVLSLDSFNVEGSLISCGWEHWNIPSTPLRQLSDDCVRRRLCEYACRRTSYPFPKLVDTHMRQTDEYELARG